MAFAPLLGSLPPDLINFIKPQKFNPLMQLGMGLLQAGGPSETPTNFGGILGKALGFTNQQKQLHDQNNLQRSLALLRLKRSDNDSERAERRFSRLLSNDKRSQSNKDREFDALQKHRKDILGLKAGKEDNKGLFGNSQTSLALTLLHRMKEKQDKGLPLSKSDLRKIDAANTTLSREQVRTTPTGDQLKFKPITVPKSLKFSEAESTAKNNLFAEGINRKKARSGIRIIDEINDILNKEPDSTTLGSNTGIVGSAKSTLGPLLRQIPGVDPNLGKTAENLGLKLKSLQSLMTSPILDEKKVTDTERERIKELVGDVRASQDVQSIRLRMKALEDFLNPILGRSPTSSVKQSSSTNATTKNSKVRKFNPLTGKIE